MTSARWNLVDLAPRGASVDSSFAWGRYRTPILSPDTARGAHPFRVKEWSYHSLATPRYFVAFAVVQLGYVAQLFAYVVDRETGERAELERMSPLGRALDFGPSSSRGFSRWRSPGAWISAGFVDDAHVAVLDLPVGKQRLRGQVRFSPDDALALLFPLGTGRPAYTHKAAGMRADGELWLGEHPIALDEAYGALDWTRSQADRHTRWNWASFSGRNAEGERLGLNLSAHVYDIDGCSMENAFWRDGRVCTLGAVCFDVPARTTDRWRIASADGSGEVALEVTPLGERKSNMDLIAIRSRFTQPYGAVRGSVRGVSVDGLFGVVEDHDALW